MNLVIFRFLVVKYVNVRLHSKFKKYFMQKFPAPPKRNNQSSNPKNKLSAKILFVNKPGSN